MLVGEQKEPNYERCIDFIHWHVGDDITREMWPYPPYNIGYADIISAQDSSRSLSMPFTSHYSVADIGHNVCVPLYLDSCPAYP